MSQFILDDQLGRVDVFLPIDRWATVAYLRDLRPGETIKDDRIPHVLLTRKTPTFITIDNHFDDRRWCHPGYAIVLFRVPHERQAQFPALLRQLVNRPDLRTRHSRMGMVARIDPDGGVTVWRFRQAGETRFSLGPPH